MQISKKYSSTKDSACHAIYLKFEWLNPKLFVWTPNYLLSKFASLHCVAASKSSHMIYMRSVFEKITGGCNFTIFTTKPQITFSIKIYSTKRLIEGKLKIIFFDVDDRRWLRKIWEKVIWGFDVIYTAAIFSYLQFKSYQGVVIFIAANYAEKL